MTDRSEARERGEDYAWTARNYAASLRYQAEQLEREKIAEAQRMYEEYRRAEARRIEQQKEQLSLERIRVLVQSYKDGKIASLLKDLKQDEFWDDLTREKVLAAHDKRIIQDLRAIVLGYSRLVNKNLQANTRQYMDAEVLTQLAICLQFPECNQGLLEFSFDTVMEEKISPNDLAVILKHAKRLLFNNITLTEATASIVSNALESAGRDYRCEELRLANTVMDPKLFANLAARAKAVYVTDQSYTKNQNIQFASESVTDLDMSNNLFYSSMIEDSFQRIIHGLPQLKHLNLSGLVFAKPELKCELLKVVVQIPGLESLNLSVCQLDDRDLEVLLPYVRNNPHLKDVGIFGNAFTPDGLNRLAAALAENTYITVLHVDKPTDALIAVIKRNNQLHQIQVIRGVVANLAPKEAISKIQDVKCGLEKTYQDILLQELVQKLYLLNDLASNEKALSIAQKEEFLLALRPCYVAVINALNSSARSVRTAQATMRKLHRFFIDVQKSNFEGKEEVRALILRSLSQYAEYLVPEYQKRIAALVVNRSDEVSLIMAKNINLTSTTLADMQYHLGRCIQQLNKGFNLFKSRDKIELRDQLIIIQNELSSLPVNEAYYELSTDMAAATSDCSKQCDMAASAMPVASAPSMAASEMPVSSAPPLAAAEEEEEKFTRIAELKAKVTSNCSDINEKFICPISKEIMKDPVIASDGFSYDRISIHGWVIRNKVNCISPTTGKSLKNSVFHINQEYRSEIIAYLKQKIASQNANVAAAARVNADSQIIRSGVTQSPIYSAAGGGASGKDVALVFPEVPTHTRGMEAQKEQRGASLLSAT